MIRCETSIRLDKTEKKLKELEFQIETLQQQMIVIYTTVGGIVQNSQNLQKGE